MVDDIVSILKRAKLFKGLNDDDIGQICRLTMPQEKICEKNQIIVNQGEPVGRIGIIKSGTVVSMKYHFDGGAQILRIFKRGETLSLDAVNTTFLTSPTALVCQTDCSIFFLPFRKIFETDQISMPAKATIMLNCGEILSNELVRLMYKIDVLSKRTLQERVLTYLSIIREKQGRDVIDICMNQEQFAQYLCVNRSVLSKELNKMRKSGLIDYKRNRYKILPDRFNEILNLSYYL